MMINKQESIINSIKENTEDEILIDIDEEIEIIEPIFYEVIMLNDDKTTMEFVVEVLMTYFDKGNLEAQELMLQIHNEGSAICGIYPYDIAEYKVEIVHKYARASSYPLQLILKEI